MPIENSSDHPRFLCSDNLTVIPASPEDVPYSEASSSKITAAIRVPMFGFDKHQETGCGDHVGGLTGTRKLDAVFDRASVATTIFSSMSRGRRDRDTNVVHSLNDRKNPQKILERKVGSAVRGERE